MYRWRPQNYDWKYFCCGQCNASAEMRNNSQIRNAWLSTNRAFRDIVVVNVHRHPRNNQRRWMKSVTNCTQPLIAGVTSASNRAERQPSPFPHTLHEHHPMARVNILIFIIKLCFVLMRSPRIHRHHSSQYSIHVHWTRLPHTNPNPNPIQSHAEVKSIIKSYYNRTWLSLDFRGKLELTINSICFSPSDEQPNKWTNGEG